MRVSNESERTRAEARAVEQSEVLPGVGLPKSLFFLAAGLSLLVSVSLFFSGDQERGIFVGIWVPSILSAGALLLGSNGND